MRTPAIDLLFTHLQPAGDCIVFTGWTDKDGYGHIHEWRGGRRRLIKVHRLVYRETVGELPDHLLVRHSCDNPPCCNPEHLLIGTQADNVNDMVERHRIQRWRKRITHCPQNHPYDEENTALTPQGWRYCKTCKREKARVGLVD